MDKESFRDMPIPLLKYKGNGKFVEYKKFGTMDNAMSYWVLQSNDGDTYRMEWWGNGWTIFYQESYLTKDLHFSHWHDIPSFNHSHFGSSEGWHHVFQTRELALETFKKFWTKGVEAEEPEDMTTKMETKET